MSAYEAITQRIIEKLEAGIIPWIKPWAGGILPCSFITRKPYRGINLFLLNVACFASPYWMTFRQCKELKGHVKAGEKATSVVYWNWQTVKDDETEEEKEVPFLKTYNVFNLDQVVLPDTVVIPNLTRQIDFDPILECEAVVEHMPLRPEIFHKEQKAYYQPT